MTHSTTRGRLARLGLIGLAAGLALTGCSTVGTTAGGDSTGAADDGTFTVGFATGGQPDADWQQLQGDVAQGLAEQRGWDFVELSNDNSEATATKNADIFIQKGVDVVMMFNGQPSANPVIAKKYEAAGIPVVTFDIAQPGWYFVGVDNAAAGTEGGTSLGELAKEKWDCKVDLVISAEGTAAGQINTWRTGNARDAVKKTCPDIPEGNYVSYEADGNLTTSLANAPGVFAAHPDAKNILVVGLNDQAVVGALQAATQLGRDGSIMGWGQDGGLITGDNVDPNLVGSVMYFLEGYPASAFEIADEIEAGNAPAVKDTGDDAAVSVQPCPVTAEEAASIPAIEDRVSQLADAPKGSTEYDLFCKA
ncbi:substrate-binding domain-containing protein [Herbiconiux sp. VKM Ac-2851]|uniref:sugar ABC transporter substrate-binding protein n=1 Tax=Herbiconiux sp. VKM Ac-2851 TaxID=2739025 RepID=UPI00156538C9|nr:substrate-binding domain-containing protein [Herbiconiux sp. VKM Ac-2851]NQX34538.1 substrate-binding domain-containing protein [Herbiconiux sp. VKM Ac-2851]